MHISIYTCVYIQGLSPKNQDQHLALTVFCVPNSLDSWCD